MRRLNWLLAALLALAPALAARAQQAPPKEQESLAEAARKVREKKKSAARAEPGAEPKGEKVVFTNDNLPGKPGSAVSTVGAEAAETSAAAPAGAPETEEQAEDEDSQERWRARFAEAREKLRSAERELGILERELQGLMVQYETDPNEALKQQFSRDKINEHTRKIQDKRAEVQQLRQELSALQDELRRKGLPAGWGREA